MNRKIREVMTAMPKTIGQGANIELAKNTMTEMKCHHLPVLEGGHLVGIISERDLKVTTAFEGHQTMSVEDIMMDEPLTVDPNITVKEAVELLLKEKVGSVIVRASEDNPWGIFTTTDALKLFVKEI